MKTNTKNKLLLVFSFWYHIACQKESVLMHSSLRIRVNCCPDTGNRLWILPLPLTPSDHKTPIGISHIVISCLMYYPNMQQSVNTRPNILTRSEGWKRLMTHCFCPITCSTRLKKLDFPPHLPATWLCPLSVSTKQKINPLRASFWWYLCCSTP